MPGTKGETFVSNLYCDAGALSDRVIDGLAALQVTRGGMIRVVLYREISPLDGGAPIYEAIDSFLMTPAAINHAAHTVIDFVLRVSLGKMADMAAPLLSMLPH